ASPRPILHLGPALAHQVAARLPHPHCAHLLSGTRARATPTLNGWGRHPPPTTSTIPDELVHVCVDLVPKRVERERTVTTPPPAARGRRALRRRRRTGARVARARRCRGRRRSSPADRRVFRALRSGRRRGRRSRPRAR